MDELIDRIVREAARVLWQATKVTLYLFWWLGLGLVALVRRSETWQQDRSLRSRNATPVGEQEDSVICPRCGTVNPSSANQCYICSKRL